MVVVKPSIYSNDVQFENDRMFTPEHMTGEHFVEECEIAIGEVVAISTLLWTFNFRSVDTVTCGVRK